MFEMDRERRNNQTAVVNERRRFFFPSSSIERLFVRFVHSFHCRNRTIFVDAIVVVTVADILFFSSFLDSTEAISKDCEEEEEEDK